MCMFHRRRKQAKLTVELAAHFPNVIESFNLLGRAGHCAKLAHALQPLSQMPTIPSRLRWPGLMAVTAAAFLSAFVLPALSPGHVLHAQTAAGNMRSQTAAGAGTPGPTLEDRVKALFLYRFPDYVEWPAAAAERPEVELCVPRRGAMGTALQDIQNFARRQNADARPRKVREVDRQDDIDSCWVLYVPAAAASNLAPLLRKAAMLPVLTVGESPDFLQMGGLINLKVVDGRVRFDIAKTAGERAGLRFRSQLLQYALSVN